MTFLYLNSDKMGDGDPVLGKKLMRGFLIHLAKSDEKIDFIGCVNSAINLTIEGSEVIDILKEFENSGTRIASCIACLEYHNVVDKLAIGKIGTMDETVELMTTADKTIRPN